VRTGGTCEVEIGGGGGLNSIGGCADDVVGGLGGSVARLTGDVRNVRWTS
jgi:hypothetical protein